MDFGSDALFDGRRLRALTAVGSREVLAVDIDNSRAFVAKALDRWAYDNNINLDVSRPSKPTDDTIAESFNDRSRDECLNAHWFL